MKQVPCSTGRWIDENSRPYRLYIKVGLMTFISAYVDLFVWMEMSQGEMSGGNVQVPQQTTGL